MLIGGGIYCYCKHPPEHREKISKGAGQTGTHLSAQQLAELLAPSVRPPVADLRAFLREHNDTVFDQVRRGGFVLGTHYQLPG